MQTIPATHKNINKYIIIYLLINLSIYISAGPLINILFYLNWISIALLSYLIFSQFGGIHFGKKHSTKLNG